jgi:citrate lyase beta subunit
VILHAAHRAGIEAMDVPCLDLRDPAVVLEEARVARRLGFTAKAAIHPNQLAAIHEVFTPSAAEVAEAEKVVAAYRASATGLAVVDGRLVEKPVVKRMERVLARAGRG